MCKIASGLGVEWRERESVEEEWKIDNTGYAAAV